MIVGTRLNATAPENSEKSEFTLILMLTTQINKVTRLKGL